MLAPPHNRRAAKASQGGCINIYVTMSLEIVHKLNMRQLQSAKLTDLAFAMRATVTVVTAIGAIDS